MRWMTCWMAAALALGGVGCDDAPADPAVPRAEPPEGPSSGYFPIEVVLPPDLDPAEITEVWVGDRRGLQVAPMPPDRLRVLVQGSATPGPAEITVWAGADAHPLGALLSFSPPIAPVFQRVVAFGASLTQGVQAGVPSFEGAFDGPAWLIARQAGADLPLPLLVPGLFPGMQASDIGPAPACAIPQVTDVVAEQTPLIVPQLQPEGGGAINARPARLDPDLVPANLAVGGSQLRHHLDGPDTLGTRVVARLVYEPDGLLLGPVDGKPVEIVEAFEPTLIVSMDAFANDLAAPLILTDDLDPASSPTLDDLEADLRRLLPRLAATGAQVFLGNMPRPSLLPATWELRAKIIAEADDPAAAARGADSNIAAIDLHAERANGLLAKVAAEHPTVHVVDLAGAVVAVERDGLTVGEHTLTTGKFGGLLGIDGIHFTDTGYGFLANLFIDAINAELGTRVPRADLTPIVALDPERPDRLAAAGLGACAPTP